MRLAAALALLLAVSGHAAFLSSPNGRPGGKSKGKRASPRKVPAKTALGPRKSAAKPAAAHKFRLPSLPSLPSRQDLLLKAEAARDSVPQSPEEAKAAAVEAFEWCREEVRPGQVFAGFATALVVFSSGLFATVGAFGDYLSADGRGEVVQRALLYGDILDSIRESYVEVSCVALAALR